MIEFFVPGIPKPGGSKRAFPIRKKDGTFVKMGMADANPQIKHWRNAVVNACLKAYSDPPMTGPLIVFVTFHIVRPKNHFGSGKNAEKVKESSPSYPITKPDCTKLWRGTEDALKGILWMDDSQIVRQVISKEYSDTPGARLKVDRIG